jgi:hypothetical protein
MGQCLAKSEGGSHELKHAVDLVSITVQSLMLYVNTAV